MTCLEYITKLKQLYSITYSRKITKKFMKEHLKEITRDEELTDAQALDIIYNHLLGPDFYMAGPDPVSNDRANAIFVKIILKKYKGRAPL